MRSSTSAGRIVIGIDGSSIAFEPAHTALDAGGRPGFYFSRGFGSLAWDVPPFAWARCALARALSPSAKGLWPLASAPRGGAPGGGVGPAGGDEEAGENP